MKYATKILLATFVYFLFCVSTFDAVGEEKSGVRYVSVGSVPNEVIKDVKASVKSYADIIRRNYGVVNMPDVTINIWQDRAEFENAYGTDAEYVQGYVNQELWEVHFYNGIPQLGLGVVHEYAHLVTLALNPEFNNNPRWLWEAVAIYESGRPPIPDISSLNCFFEDSYPTITQLNEHPFNIYKVGYSIVDFILSRWGREQLINLIKSNGDIRGVLGISTSDFEKGWIAFLKTKHGLVLATGKSSNC